MIEAESRVLREALLAHARGCALDKPPPELDVRFVEFGSFTFRLQASAKEPCAVRLSISLPISAANGGGAKPASLLENAPQVLADCCGDDAHIEPSSRDGDNLTTQLVNNNSS
eukprot:jgi/Chlat1/3283/Chrsp22S03529